MAWVAWENPVQFNVNSTFFGHFWQVYRNGMQHQATPKTYKIGGITYKWSFDAE